MKNHLIKLAFVVSVASPVYAQQEISMWYHGVDNPEESTALKTIIDSYNAKQSNFRIVLNSLPEEDYNESVENAALAGNLPCIIDVDGPVMPRWAWAGYLQPLPLDASHFDGFLKSTRGEWNGELYSVGLWDAAVAMIARQSTLEKHGIRIPTLDVPWTRDEFTSILEILKASGEYDYPLDLGMAWAGEWYPYSFSPFLQSFGGDIIDRATYQSASGALDGPQAVAFAEWWQSLFAEGYAAGTDQSGEDRNSGFIEGRYAITYNGNWAAPSILEEFDDVLFLPNVDMGNGSVIGAASWQFGISSFCPHTEGAAEFIAHAMETENLVELSNATGLIPATVKAAEGSEFYNEDGKMNVFYGLSEAQSFVRPVTPGYPIAAKALETALVRIAEGNDISWALNGAVEEIAADIAANGDYDQAKRCNQVLLEDGRWLLRRCRSDQQ